MHLGRYHRVALATVVLLASLTWISCDSADVHDTDKAGKSAEVATNGRWSDLEPLSWEIERERVKGQALVEDYTEDHLFEGIAVLAALVRDHPRSLEAHMAYQDAWTSRYTNRDTIVAEYEVIEAEQPEDPFFRLLLFRAQRFGGPDANAMIVELDGLQAPDAPIEDVLDVIFQLESGEFGQGVAGINKKKRRAAHGIELPSSSSFIRLAKSGALDEAWVVIDRILEGHPEHWDFSNVFRHQFDSEGFDSLRSNLLRRLQEIAQEHPNDPWRLSEIANMYANAGRLEDAESMFPAIQALDAAWTPDTVYCRHRVRVKNELGSFCATNTPAGRRRVEDAKDAAADIGWGSTAASLDGYSRLNQGPAYAQAAIDSYEQALTAPDPSPLTSLTLARILIEEERDPARAESLISDAAQELQAEPFTVARGAFFDERMRDSAKTLDIRLAKKRAFEAEIEQLWGWSQHLQGRDEEAATHLRRAVLCESMHRRAWCRLGVVERELGHSRAAFDALVRAWILGEEDAQAERDWMTAELLERQPGWKDLDDYLDADARRLPPKSRGGVGAYMTLWFHDSAPWEDHTFD